MATLDEISGMTPEQMQALGLALPADSTPVAAFNPSQPLHTPQGVLPPIVSGGKPAITPGTPEHAEELANKGLIADQMGKQIYRANMPQLTASPGTEDYWRQRQEQLDYNKAHPWGSPISAHPGVLGKILHVISKGANIAGDIVAPGATSLIPGSDLNRKLEEGENAAGITSATENTEREAQTGSLAEQTKEAPEKLELEKQKEEDIRSGAWKAVPTLVGPNGEPIEMNESTGDFRYGQLAGAKPVRTPAETQEQNKLAFQSVIGKLDAAGLPTDAKHIDKSLDAAMKKGFITPAEHASARAYQSANTTPGTNLTVHLEEAGQAQQAALDKMFEGHEVIANVNGKRVQMSYGEAKKEGLPIASLTILPPNEAQQNRDKLASIETYFKQLNSYRNDFRTAAPQLTSQDRDALKVLASHAESGKMAGILGGLVDELPIAGPLSSYANRLLDGTLTSDQYAQLSPAGKKLVSDYFNTVIANFANMKNQLGSIGRNPMQLQAEINTIPLPFLDWESADIAFKNKRDQIQGNAASLPQIK